MRRNLLRNFAVAAAATAVVCVISIGLAATYALGPVYADALGALLVLAALFNAVGLGLVLTAALRPPPDGVMDERLRSFLLTTLAGCVFGVIGVNQFTGHWLPAGAGLALVVIGVFLYSGVSVLFLLAFWRAGR